MVQYLISINGWNPLVKTSDGSFASCGPDTLCQARLGTIELNVDSIVLFGNGFSSLIQTLVLTTIGSLADYGNNGNYILLAVTLLSCAAQIVFLTFDETKSGYWGLALLIQLVFQVTYGVSLVFYWAYFPVLATNDPKIRNARRELGAESSDYQEMASMMRNHISTISTAWSNIGFFVLSLLLVGVAYGLSAHYNTPWQTLPKYSNSIFSAICGGYWLLFAIPWFALHKSRPGPPLPPNTNYLTFGWKQGWALREYRRLPQTFLFLLGYFFLNDAVNSTSALTQIISNKITNYDSLLQTYFNLINSVCSIIGCFLFLYLQKYFNWTTKRMLQISIVATLLVPLWGCIGIGSSTLGFRNVTEIWIYQAWFGIFTAPFYAYSQTLMSELIPFGKENMFFALFGIIGKLSQFTGPLITSSITGTTQNIRAGFIMCAVCQFLPVLIIGCIDMHKAEMHIKVYEEKERRNISTEEVHSSNSSVSSVFYYQKTNSN
ncbi:autophagy-related protein 22-like protein [Spinellus fusiger]|nr:autophagy-related protein 22-like protein [Spinellus fusiger]